MLYHLLRFPLIALFIAHLTTALPQDHQNGLITLFCYHEPQPLLNDHSCKTLLSEHIPSVMKISEPGYWDPKSTHDWYLNVPSHNPDECVLRLVPTSESAKTKAETFKPEEFLRIAQYILQYCPQRGYFRGGSGVVPGHEDWTVILYTTGLYVDGDDTHAIQAATE